MKKIHLILTIGLTLFLTSAWAEKYEYVHLKGKTESIGSVARSDTSWLYFHDSFTLESGDTAEIVATISLNYIYVEDDEGDIFQYDYNTGGAAYRPTIIVGPCTVYFATTSSNASLVGQKETWRIKRASSSGSTTLAWSGTEWTNPNSSTQVANNNSSGSVQYDTLLGWCYFTDTPWLYSYTNGSWYYMKSINNEVYVWNANLPDGGWTKFRG